MPKLHPEFAPVAFLAAFTLLLPLPWHWRARNVATLSIIAWLFVSNMIYAIDAVVWADNVRDVGRVWCDITTKLIIGANFALPAACLCLCLHLEFVSSSRMGNMTLRDKRKRQIFEACLCAGLPLLFMALHTIVQGHRYDIIEGYGCRPTTYFSIPSIFIVWLPPILMACVCLVLSMCSLRNFVLRRLTFAADLKIKNTGLTTSRYLRLISMAIVQMIWSIVVTSYTLYVTTVGIPLRPWTTWADVHSDFNRVDVFPAIITPKQLRNVSYGLWWMIPASTILFVAFFSFGQDAMDEYKKCYVWIRTKVFRIPLTEKKSKFAFSFVKQGSSKPVLPISKPVLQSTTSSDYTLPPSYDMSTSTDSNTRASMSSLGKTETTLHGHSIDKCYDEENPFEYHYQLRASAKFSTNFQQPKAIGSVSDLSILSPSTTVMGCSELTPKALDSGISYPSSTFPAQSRVPVPSYEDLANKPLPPSPTSAALSHAEMVEVAQEPTSASRLRPLLLLGQRENARRPVTYPSHEAERWTPEGAEDARR
ncbi:pheromone receptor [Ephemerocybe angulata]|uniref:Pheromone receptor n=1 Tax=Ephemerocybe angulata TaxID=980116 RepID=A0A8H6LXC8_9AGAR|nr:pheromone receptor [Tulosesus angulatus]